MNNWLCTIAGSPGLAGEAAQWPSAQCSGAPAFGNHLTNGHTWTNTIRRNHTMLLIFKHYFKATFVVLLLTHPCPPAPAPASPSDQCPSHAQGGGDQSHTPQADASYANIHAL